MSNKPFTKHDMEMLEIIRDPVKWTEHHLGEKPRWYQEQILRHPHHRKVLRCGRRIGKCIEESQRIMNPVTGEYKTVGELFREQKENGAPALLTLNEEYHLEKSEAFFVEDNGMKESFAVVTKHGAQVVLTGNHPVLTVNGWVEVDALKIGEHIAVPSALPFYGEEQMPEETIRLLAYLLAAGQFNKRNTTFQLRYPEIYESFVESAKFHGLEVRTVEGNRKQTLEIIGLTAENFPYYSDVVARRIPKDVYKLEREQLMLFLGSLYGAGGWFYAKRIAEVGFATRDKSFALDLKHLLLRFGIRANLLEKTVEDAPYFHLMVYHNASIALFIELLASKQPERKEEYDVVSQKAMSMKPSDPVLPREVWPHLEKERKDKGLKKTEVAGGKDRRLRTTKGITLSNARIYAENLQSAFLWDLINSDVLWEEVVDIIPLGKKQTYDVFVPETHNLVVEDILVHNTWTMCAHMLWVAFTCNGGTEIKKGATCIVATPYDNQARLIFDQLKTFIDNNPVLRESVSSMTKNPYVVQFKNKSIIRLFTAGTRSGSEGGSLRGQKASWLYMDEVDYMTDKDFEAIYAITFEAPKRIGVMVASTPTGRRGMFHKLCTQMQLNMDVKRNENNFYDMRTYDRHEAEGWQEFYYPTMVNPEWDEKMERELRMQFSEVAYEHEVLAEFGTEMVGVFNKDYIDEAASNGYALHKERQHGGPIAIGIDWDKFGNATQIVVTQWNPYDMRRPRPEIGETSPQMGRFTVINRIEIPKGEFTYDIAVKKIIELDKIYNPFAIYPDRGAGEYQIEMLRKELGDKVKGVHFGGSHMVRDPYSREFDKKPIKPFMVNQTNLILERGQLRIPNRDTDETIARQMTNYQVERISPKTGEPTYSNDDEHALDGLMLCILAFIIEKPEIAQTVMKSDPATNVGSTRLNFVDPLAHIHNNQDGGRSSLSSAWDEPKAPVVKRRQSRSQALSWGARGSMRESRKMPSRGSW